ncbi:MAG: hypothetical protein PHG16_02965 [Lachnospiraceae bacterium]|nr:hypothetical protein [Lachnospiraceae bacterium]
MNRADYHKVMDEIMGEIRETEGTFQSVFGKKSEKELEEISYIAGIALFAADRLYSNVTKVDYTVREIDENGGNKKC